MPCAAPMPLALSDSQLAAVMAAAASLPLEKRSVFLERIAAQLACVRRPGDADVERAAQMALRGPDNFNDVLDRQVRQLLMKSGRPISTTALPARAAAPHR